MNRTFRVLAVIVLVVLTSLMVVPVLAQNDASTAAQPTAETLPTRAINQVNAENLVSEISPMTFDIVSQILTLGFAVMLAALFYFVLTIRTVAPRFRISSVLSVVVMVSAFLILYFQSLSWQNGFVYDPVDQVYRIAAGSDAFSNGYRYLNWLIDVPMLLFQILFIVEITRERRASLRNWFFFSGAMMIITGYIGQFYEASNPTLWYIWGAISTIFFGHVLYLIYNVIKEGKANMSERAGKVFGLIWPLFFVSWMLYPGAYLMPIFLNTEGFLSSSGIITEAGIVGRQMTYTIADISSKVVYGIMLTYVAQIRSEEEGFVSEMSAAPAPATGD